MKNFKDSSYKMMAINRNGNEIRKGFDTEAELVDYANMAVKEGCCSIIVKTPEMADYNAWNWSIA